MKLAHKIIKYCAIAFALILIVSIVTGVIRVLGVFGAFTSDDAKLTEFKTFDIENAQDINSLSIDIGAANLDISLGEEFSVSTNNKNINCDTASETLIVKEARDRFFSFGYTSDGTCVNITVPEGFEFSEVEISAGAGKINIRSLLTGELEIDIGAGKFDIDELKVTGNAKIEGGAGDFIIGAGEIKNLDFDMGVGDTTLTLALLGDCEINMGVGDLDLYLLGEKESYKLDVDKGIGEARIDGLSISNGNSFGNGTNRIDIDGGVGSINVQFK